MGSPLTDLITKTGYHLGMTITSTSRWSTDQVTSFLNDALKEVVKQLYNAKCWRLLREIERTHTYTLDGTGSYSVYDVIGDTDYYGFVKAEWSTRKLREIVMNMALEVEYELITTTPGIYFYGYDDESEHGNLPLFKIVPSGLTGDLKFYSLKNPPTMDAETKCCLPDVCDNAIIFLTCAWCWSGDRNSEQYLKFNSMFEKQMANLITEYEEPYWGELV